MNIEFYQHLLNATNIANTSSWDHQLNKQLKDIFSQPPHGHFSQWQVIVNQLSCLQTKHYEFDRASIVIGQASDVANIHSQQIEMLLKALLPWRKGPFNFFGIDIDSEWRCDQKWQRVQRCLPCLQDKSILDVGCGNGYYMLRMLGDGAKSVIGVDPTLIFLAQFYALTQNLNTKLDAHLLPLTFEQLPNTMNHFDVIFSMGVLYHRRNPQEHLQRLFSHLNNGGKLILETLIINNHTSEQLIPEQRYAGMRNVWSVPTPSLIEAWLQQSGFKNIELHDQRVTSVTEQRATEWTKNFSLQNFLDPNDTSKTIEGYPAPVRAIFSAQKT